MQNIKSLLKSRQVPFTNSAGLIKYTTKPIVYRWVYISKSYYYNII